MSPKFQYSITKLQRDRGCVKKINVSKTLKDARSQKSVISKHLKYLQLKIEQNVQTIQNAPNFDVRRVFSQNKQQKEKFYEQFFHHQLKNNETLLKIQQNRSGFHILYHKLLRAQQNVCKIKTLEKQLIDLEDLKTQYQKNNLVIQQDFFGYNISIDELRIKAIQLEQQNNTLKIQLQELNQKLEVLSEQINELKKDISKCYVNPSELQNILTHLIQNPYDFSIRILKVKFQEVRNKLEAIYHQCQQKYDLNDNKDKIKFQLETNTKFISHYDYFIRNNYQDRLYYCNILNQEQQINIQKVSYLDQLIKNIKSIPLLYQRIEKLGKYICDVLDHRIAVIQDDINQFEELHSKKRQIILFSQNYVSEDRQIQQIVEEEKEGSDSPSIIEELQYQLFIISHQAQQHNYEVQLNEFQQEDHQEIQSIRLNQEEHKEN
ncbi:hypothetical protein pb186bvf_010630 [Paramecium bursaria]